MVDPSYMYLPIHQSESAYMICVRGRRLVKVERAYKYKALIWKLGHLSNVSKLFIVPTKPAKTRQPWLLVAIYHISIIMATSALKFSR